MSFVPIFPSRLDWPSTIGNFLLNFGTLEYLVNIYLQDHIDPAEFSKVKVWHLKDRLTRVAQDLVNSRPVQVQGEFNDLLARLDPIRDLRNHIAHGYFILLLNDKGHAPEVLIARPIDAGQENTPEARHVTFGELRAHLTELTEVIEGFKRIVGFSDSISSA